MENKPSKTNPGMQGQLQLGWRLFQLNSFRWEQLSCTVRDKGLPVRSDEGWLAQWCSPGCGSAAGAVSSSVSLPCSLLQSVQDCHLLRQQPVWATHQASLWMGAETEPEKAWETSHQTQVWKLSGFGGYGVKVLDSCIWLLQSCTAMLFFGWKLFS